LRAWNDVDSSLHGETLSFLGFGLFSSVLFVALVFFVLFWAFFSYGTATFFVTDLLRIHKFFVFNWEIDCSVQRIGFFVLLSWVTNLTLLLDESLCASLPPTWYTHRFTFFWYTSDHAPFLPTTYIFWILSTVLSQHTGCSFFLLPQCCTVPPSYPFLAIFNEC
jgi:hypothetical protein